MDRYSNSPDLNESDEKLLVVPISEDISPPFREINDVEGVCIDVDDMELEESRLSKPEEPSILFTPKVRVETRDRSNTEQVLIGSIQFPQVATPASDDEVPMLSKQLTLIQGYKSARQQHEKAVLIFNNKPKEAYQFLKSQTQSENPIDEFAYFLLVTEGLDKIKIGRLIGSPDDFEMSVLKSYCGMLDFNDIEFDKALRGFLEKFRLPGEAQQIDRIMSAFTESYYGQNPSMFPDQDTTYVLAFSLILLNTDAHNANIAEHRKMTKPQFINNNRELLATLTEEYLGDMYDRIVNCKFETPLDDTEILYKRIVGFNENPVYLTQTQRTLQIAFQVNERNQHLLQEGSVMMKYNFHNRGKPDKRRIFLDEQEHHLCWHKPGKEVKHPSKIDTRAIIDIFVGADTTPVLQRHSIHQEYDDLWFSVVTATRTLDLQCNDVETRDIWVNWLRNKASENANSRRQGSGAYERQETVAEVWQNKILPNIEDYWDMPNKCPKMIKQVTPGSRGGCFCKKQKAKEVDVLTNKGFLLVKLWRQGLPRQVRTHFWPYMIGDSLQITERLYKSISEECEAGFTKSNTMTMAKLANDVPKMDLDHVDSVLKLISCYVFYRPDVSYISCMAYVADTLINNLGEEGSNDYFAFKTFANMIHSYHFHQFYADIDSPPIKWRVEFFDKQFRKMAPRLKKHFERLSIDSRLFIYDWWSHLFSTTFPKEVVGRVWDNFFLDGESSAMLISLSILKYFESDLMKSNFDQIMQILARIPDSINEDQLFEYFGTFKKVADEYKLALAEFKKADDKAAVLMATLVTS